MGGEEFPCLMDADRPAHDAAVIAAAHLIAAAPELYDALAGSICAVCGNRIGWNGDALVGKISGCLACRPKRAALAKARGETTPGPQAAQVQETP